MKTKTPKFKKGQKVIITLLNDRNCGNEAEVKDIVGEQYGNFIRYVVKLENGSTAIEYEEDLVQADTRERRHKHLYFVED